MVQVVDRNELVNDWNNTTSSNGVEEGRVSIIGGETAYSGNSMAVTYPANKFGSGDDETGAQWKLEFGQGDEAVE